MVPTGTLLNSRVGRASVAQSTSAKWYLYTGDALAGTTFNVYPVDGSKPIRQFNRRWGVRAMALDPWNDVYTADGSPDNGQITAYTPGGKSTLLAINTDLSWALAFDSSGNLYEANTLAVEEYAGRSTKLLRVIRRNTNGADALAFDDSGNLYVGRLGGSIEVFASGANRPFRSITVGISLPYSLLVAKSGDLLVANCPSCYGSSHVSGSVTEYAPGSGTPFRTLTKGVDAPIAMIFGWQGRLFVANAPSSKKGSVVVYRSGRTPVRTITDGINGPDSLAVDSKGHLYVANWHGDITVYSPDGSRLLRTISKGVGGPSSIAIGKN